MWLSLTNIPPTMEGIGALITGRYRKFARNNWQWQMRPLVRDNHTLCLVFRARRNRSQYLPWGRGPWLSIIHYVENICNIVEPPGLIGFYDENSTRRNRHAMGENLRLIWELERGTYRRVMNQEVVIEKRKRGAKTEGLACHALWNFLRNRLLDWNLSDKVRASFYLLILVRRKQLKHQPFIEYWGWPPCH